jgi:hypothetical protein
MVNSIFRRFPGGLCCSDVMVRKFATQSGVDIANGFWESTGGATYYGIFKRWTGAAWVKEPLKTFLSGSWQSKPLKRWSGAAWLLIDTTGV